MDHENKERAAAILGRQAEGLLALDDVLAELADADCVTTIASLVGGRIRMKPEAVAAALDAPSDERISVMCRAAGFSLNGFSALLRMRRRRNQGRQSAAAALASFSTLTRAAAERALQQMMPRPPRQARRFH